MGTQAEQLLQQPSADLHDERLVSLVVEENEPDFLDSCVSRPHRASTALRAASSSGQPYAPAETAGKTTVFAPSSSATRKDSR